MAITFFRKVKRPAGVETKGLEQKYGSINLSPSRSADDRANPESLHVIARRSHQHGD